MNYDVSDGELIYLYRNNNYYAFETLLSRYRKRIYGMIEKAKNVNHLKYLDFDDFYHSCYIALIKCIDNFNNEGIFYSYVMAAIENVIGRLLEKENRYKNVVSIEDYHTVLSEDFIGESTCVYENSGIDKFINEQIDKESKEIIYYKYLGYSSKEISNLTNLSLKQIYNRINKAKNILKTGGYH